jgi:aspartyl-tRNA(Asn)/glutamyl-tRNA(Gln) amidotransferase subunit C
MVDMSALSRDDVAHLAMLARIELTDVELDRMLGELSVILDAVALVQQAPTEGVEPMSHPLPLVNVTRPDEVRPGLTADQALAGAPEKDQQRFSVPRILTDD